MDAIIGDKFAYGRRLRPVTLEYAIRNFPSMIVNLKQGRLQVHKTGTVRGKEVVHVCRPNFKETELIILRSDFEKCREIARKVSVPLFPADDLNVVYDRIRAHLRVEFGPPLPPLPIPPPCRNT